jgi:hypothetical protein
MVESTSEEIVDVAPPQKQSSIADLLKLARQARDSGDRVGAETYYQAIYEKDNDNWEAIFYLAYFPLSNTSFNGLDDNSAHYVGTIGQAFELAKAGCDNHESFIAFVDEVIGRTLEVTDKITDSIKECYPHIFEYAEYCSKIGSSTSTLVLLAETIDIYVDNGERTEEATQLRKKGIQILADAAKRAKVPSDGYARIYKEHTDKILAVEPTYINPLIGYKAPSISSTTNVSQSKSGCYVATAVYGSYDCPQVWTLRRFRDYTLAETWYGRAFVKTYYAISPTLVRWFGKTNWFKKMWRIHLDKLVSRLQNKGVDDTPYNDRVW